MAKYFYNGVLLPEIPADVLAEYPYAWIRKHTTNDQYQLIFAKHSWYYKSGGVYCSGGESVTEPWYNITMSKASEATEWTFSKNTAGYFTVDDARSVFWSNHDIPNGSATSTTIYFYGSEPVPETPPFDKKYLIRSNSTLYTIANGALSALTETEVTASLFQTYGVDDLPNGILLVGLTDPEVLYWQDSNDALPIINLTVRGSPPAPQIVTSGLYNLRHNTILGISHATVVASTDVLFAVSFDGGATWLAHNGATWYIVDDQTAGMSAERFNSVTAEQWEEVVVLESLMIRFVLPNTTAFVTSVVLHYINP